MFRVIFFIMLLQLPRLVYSQEFDSCSQAISELERGNASNSRELLRIYIIESYQQSENDARCNLKFVQNLTKQLVVQLNGDYLHLCDQGLENPNVAGLASMDLIASRIQSLGYKLDSKAKKCRIQYQKQYEGISWLEHQNPEVADILKNCHMALEILESPMSEIRLSQANSFIRVAELGLMREKESAKPTQMSNWVRNLYRFRLSDAKNCVLRARFEFEQFNQRPDK